MDAGLVMRIKRRIGQRERYKDEFSRSRQYLVLEGITGIGQYSLATGAFIAGFISFLGGSTTLNGTVGVIPAALGIIQALAALTLTGKKSRKDIAITVAIIIRVMLAMVYFVPYVIVHMTGNKEVALIAFVGCYIIAFAFNGILGPLVGSMIVDMTPIQIRGKYLAGRERISLIIISALTIGLGKVLDYYKVINLQGLGFVVVGIVVAVLGALNIYSLVKLDDIKVEDHVVRKGYLKSLVIPFKDIKFRKVLVLNGIWNFSLFFGITFIAVYMVEDLELSYTYIMSMSVFATAVRVVSSHFWGNMADKKSWVLAAGLSVMVLGMSHFVWGLVTIENYKILIPLLNMSSGFGWAGAGIALFNLQFMYANPKNRTMSIGVNAAVGGVLSLVGVQVGGYLMRNLGGYSLDLGFGNIGSMQIIFMISGLLTLLCPLFMWLRFREKTSNPLS